MAKYASQFSSVTMSVADGVSIGTAGTNGFMGVTPNTALQRINVSEIYIGGEAASASTVAPMAFGRATTLAATATAGSANTILTDISGAASGTNPLGFTNGSTTSPIVTAAARILRLSYNAYGGIVRWVASPDQMVSAIGVAAYVAGTQGAGGQLILTQVSGTAATMSGHILYEVV